MSTIVIRSGNTVKLRCKCGKPIVVQCGKTVHFPSDNASGLTIDGEGKIVLTGKCPGCYRAYRIPEPDRFIPRVSEESSTNG